MELNRIRTDIRTQGVNFHKEGSARVVLWSPFANSVEIEVNNRNRYSLKKADYGYWVSENSDLSKGDQYFFILNGEDRYPDPASLCQPEGVHGPSGIPDLNFNWKDKKWKGIPLQQMIIYELHTGTFTKEADFEGIIKKIDYLKDLGINTLEIMPVSQFPGNRNWGYDISFPYAVHYSYGGIAGLRRLVNECHDNGMAVILDVVYNHLGPEGCYLPVFGPYLTDKYTIPWGRAINFDDAWCDGVRQFYIENALMWFRDFHVDALRLDAVHAIKDMSAKHVLAEMAENVQKLSRELGKKFFLIGECDLNDVRYITPLRKNGLGLHAQWVDEFHHALHSLVTGEINGYYADFGSPDQMVKAFREAYVYNGIYSEFRKKIFGSSTAGIPGHKFVAFSQNHDQTGNRMMGERLSSLVDIEMLKLSAGTVLISPFVPLLFMGEEYGEENPFLYFNSHSDPDLIRTICQGRKEEFKSFEWSYEPPDPQDPETFERSCLNWDFNGDFHKKKLLAFYKKLIKIRKYVQGITFTDREKLTIESPPGKNILIAKRKGKDRLLYCILNFENELVKINLGNNETDTFDILLNSAEARWGGPLEANNAPGKTKKIAEVNGKSILILTRYLS